MTTRTEILKMMSDGAFHSGTDLGKKLGITRAAVCKNIHHLVQSGLEIHRVTGRGYKLEAPLILLDRARLLKLLGNRAEKVRDRLHVVDEVDSTNRYLDAQITDRPDINGATCVTECQSGGRGRRGRFWIATPYGNLMLSMAWQFPGGPSLVSGLSLAAGVAIVHALEEYGVSGVGLKWPNDLLWENQKLAGILVDVQGEANGPTRVILGLGVNVHISREDAGRIDQPWVDLRGIVGEAIDRNRLTAIVIRHLLDMFQLFAGQGFAPFRADWQKLHRFQGQRVHVHHGDKVFTGIAEGVDASGGLIVRQARNKQVFLSGEVSLRAS